MLIVALNWLYVIFTTYAMGYGFHHVLTGIPFLQKKAFQKRNADLRTTPYVVRFRESYLITGIVIVTMYAQIWSLFSGVAFMANLILYSFSIGITVYALYQLRHNVLARGWERKLNARAVILYVAVFVALAYFTSHGYEHYDTGLYHAQAIHWNETFGAVIGLGSFNQRLAYNSSIYPLSSLYSFSWLYLSGIGKQSYHTLAGYFALLLAWKCCDLRRLPERGYPTLADAVRLVSVYYIFTILDEIVSPASDYFAMTLVLYILISWLELDRDREKGFYPYAMLCVLVVYAVTVKLSTAPLLLLTLKPLGKIIKAHHVIRKKTIFFFLGLGIFELIPFFIRNVIISGWLVYPFTGLDLFNVQWKIPKGTAQYDAHEIAVYGRGYTDAARYDIPVSQWFGTWWSTLGRTDQILFIADILCALGLVIFGIVYYVTLRRHRPDNKVGKLISLARHRTVSTRDFVFVECVLFASLLFWFLSSPLIRYGAVYIWLPVTLMAGKLISSLYHVKGMGEYVQRGLILLICVFIAYKSFRMIQFEIPRFDAGYLVRQQDYSTFDLVPYEIDGVTLYYPESGDRTGYEPFPSAPTRAGVELRGTSLREGFRRAH